MTTPCPGGPASPRRRRRPPRPASGRRRLPTRERAGRSVPGGARRQHREHRRPAGPGRVDVELGRGRWIAPRPVPAVPADRVAVPEARRRGRRSRARGRAPGSRARRALPSPNARPRISPPPACLTRFVAASVTTIATRPTSASSKPEATASAVARRRASPAALGSFTPMTNGSPHRHRTIVTLVPSPRRDSMSNSLTAAGRRRARARGRSRS